MNDGRVLLVADMPGLITERLGRAWMSYADFDRHELVCSSEIHPFEVRRRAERLVHWIDPLAFAQYPSATRVPQVVMVHHLTEPEVAPMLEALRHADFITTSSRRWQKKLASVTPWEPIVIPYSVDASVFIPRSKVEAMKSLGLTPGRYVLGFSGRALANTFERKGVGLFLEVVRSARKEWNDLAVALIGQGWETLRAQIEGQGIEVAHFKPSRTEETALVYPAMDAFLCTSNEEGGPCTVLEAMSCEVPTITTDVGHIPEVVTDGTNGFVIPDMSAGAFVRCIRALRVSPELARKIGIEGRRFILNNRDERVATSRVDFHALYETAEANFGKRNRSELSLRAFPMLYLRMRYGARLAANAVRRR